MNAPIPRGLNGHDSAAGIMAERKHQQDMVDAARQGKYDYEAGEVEAHNIIEYDAHDAVFTWEMLEGGTGADLFNTLMRLGVAAHRDVDGSDADAIKEALIDLVDEMVSGHAAMREAKGFTKPAMFRRPQ